MDRSDPRYDELAKGLEWSSIGGTLAGSRRLCVSWTSPTGDVAWRYHEIPYWDVSDARRVPSWGADMIERIVHDMQEEILWLVSGELPS